MICLIAFIATAEYVVCVSEESEAFIDMSSIDLFSTHTTNDFNF